MNHLGDTNKKVRDTPRTDARRGFHGLDTAVDAEFSEQLERELNEANARIKRLEEAGDEMANAYEEICHDSYDQKQIVNWRKAKEAKL